MHLACCTMAEKPEWDNQPQVASPFCDNNGGGLSPSSPNADPMGVLQMVRKYLARGRNCCKLGAIHPSEWLALDQRDSPNTQRPVSVSWAPHQQPRASSHKIRRAKGCVTKDHSPPHTPLLSPSGRDSIATLGQAHRLSLLDRKWRLEWTRPNGRPELSIGLPPS